MIDHFDRDASGFGFVEGSRGVAVEGFPSGFVDFGFEGGFERFIGIVGSEEVGMTNEKAFFVVVGIDEPAGDAVGSTGFDFARLGTKYIYAVYFDLDLVGLLGDFDVGFSEDDEEIACSSVFQVAHMEICVHAGFEDGDATELGEVGGVGIEAEGTGNQNIKACVACFTSCRDEIWTGDGAKF